MPLIPKPNYNQIFASQAPDIDKPAVFNNYPEGWGPESRPNNGKPTIKGFNYLQQTSDLKDLWILQNGAALPYDATMEYAENAHVVKDGELQQWKDGEWRPVLNEKTDEVYAKLKRENVSVWDFFTKSEIQAYNLAILNGTSASFDSYRQVQDFLDYIADNDVGTAYCSATVYVSQGLRIGRAGTSKTKFVQGYFNVYAMNSIDTLILNEAGQYFRWDGFIYVEGNLIGSGNTASWLRRGCRIGFATSPDYSSSRQNWGGVRCHRFYETGLLVQGFGTLSNYGRLRASQCGSATTSNSATHLSASFSEKVDTGSFSSATQRSTITVTALPPETISSKIFVLINGELFSVESIDRAASKISLFPYLNGDVNSGTLAYIFGSGVEVRNKDSSVVGFDTIDVVSSGSGVNSAAMYNIRANTICSQANTIGMIIGGDRGAASLGGSANSMYVEGNDADLLVLSTSGAYSNFFLASTYAMNFNKVATITSKDSSYRSTAIENRGLIINYKGAPLYSVGSSKNANSQSGSASKAVDIFSRVNFNRIDRINTVKYALSEIDKSVNNVFGIDSGTIVVTGTTQNAPTSVTFTKPSDATYTLNGGANDLVFSGFSGVAVFMIYAEINSNNYIVRLVQGGGLNAASVTYDPPSLAAAGTSGDSITTTVTLDGAAMGNNVSAAFSRYNAAIEISAVVSATNTVTVKFRNTGASVVDLASGTLTVKLI